MTNLDSIFKSRDITLPTKVRLVKAMVFPVVMYGCEPRLEKLGTICGLLQVLLGRALKLRCGSTALGGWAPGWLAGNQLSDMDHLKKSCSFKLGA